MKTLKSCIIFIALILTLTVFGACKDNSADVPSAEENTAQAAATSEAPTSAATESPENADTDSTDEPYVEPTQAPAIEPAVFDASSIKVGDMISVFCVKSIATDGNDVTSITFSGNLTVNGLLKKTDSGDYCFTPTSEYSPLLPLPEGAISPEYITLEKSAADELVAAYDAVSITIYDYVLTVASDGTATACCNSFVQTMGDYAIIG